LGAEIRNAGLKLHLIMNAYWEPLAFELPAPEPGRAWRRWIDTSLESPNDIVPWQDAPIFADGSYRAGPRSVVALWAPLEQTGGTGATSSRA
jgi:glycogen operon protein